MCDLCAEEGRADTPQCSSYCDVNQIYWRSVVGINSWMLEMTFGTGMQLVNFFLVILCDDDCLSNNTDHDDDDDDDDNDDIIINNKLW